MNGMCPVFIKKRTKRGKKEEYKLNRTRQRVLKKGRDSTLKSGEKEKGKINSIYGARAPEAEPFPPVSKSFLSKKKTPGGKKLELPRSERDFLGRSVADLTARDRI